MQSQKKRNSNTSKKLKNNKSESQLKMPIGTLMNQISQLKSQLAEIKSKKAIQPQKSSQSQFGSEHHRSEMSKISYKNQIYDKIDKYTSPGRGNQARKILQMGSPSKVLSPDHSKTMNKFLNINKEDSLSAPNFSSISLHQLKFPIRQHELKLNIEFNKLYRYIRSLPSHQHMEILTQQLNKNIEYLNKFIAEVEECHQNNGSQTFNLEEILCQQKQRVIVLEGVNKKLQREVIELRHALAMQNDQVVIKNQESDQIYEANIELMRKQEEIVEQLEHIRTAYEGLKDERERLEEKLRIFQKAVQQKQEQIIVLEEDINYNRQQSEKHRSQKKQLQKIYKQLSQNYKILKNKYENQVEVVSKQKQKWKKECQNRRLGQNQLLAHQEHKNALKKELEQMRREGLLKNTEYNDMKSKFHEEQRRNITLEGENYQLVTENEKLKRAVQFCKQQIKDMGQEVQEMRRYADKCREKSGDEHKKTKKNQTLDQIRELIHGHRRAVLAEDAESSNEGEE